MQNEYKLAVKKNSNHHQWEISEEIGSREAEVKDLIIKRKFDPF